MYKKDVNLFNYYYGYDYSIKIKAQIYVQICSSKIFFIDTHFFYKST